MRLFGVRLDFGEMVFEDLVRAGTLHVSSTAAQSDGGERDAEELEGYPRSLNHIRARRRRCEDLVLLVSIRDGSSYW